MLVKLTAEQISTFWDIIKFAIIESHPQTTPMGLEELNIIFEELLCDAADCWVSCNKENRSKIEGIIITKVIYDNLTRNKNLLIYSIYMDEGVDRMSWPEGAATLGKWAVKNGCRNIVGFTDNPQIVTITEKFGGSSLTFVILDVENLRT